MSLRHTCMLFVRPRRPISRRSRTGQDRSTEEMLLTTNVANRRALLLAAGACLFEPVVRAADAADDPKAFPSRPVRIIVPFPAGAVTDVHARAAGQWLSNAWRQPVVVENR